MQEAIMKLTEDYIKKFDVVLAHAFEIFKSKQEGAELPSFMEVEMYNKAKRYALALHRVEFLEEMYKRIMEGKI